MSAPITTHRIGSKMCPGCEKALVGGGEVLEVEGGEPVRNRYGGFSDGRTRLVTRRWHATCLAEFEARNQALRDQVAEDRRRTAFEIGRAAGMSDERIEELIARASA